MRVCCTRYLYTLVIYRNKVLAVELLYHVRQHA